MNAPYGRSDFHRRVRIRNHFVERLMKFEPKEKGCRRGKISRLCDPLMTLRQLEDTILVESDFTQFQSSSFFDETQNW
jgi:hypothetical protein